ncbi:HNH endonuclease [Nodosilinea nodulosa]|uniref:HNH endonuclease n=1 Tax=Nodosilinea nodulosa TaxID=416001 RepID=UPI0008FAEFFB|nr:HNH endonuclease signature motif containing protein [Nodosilinea nodulosa]
MAYIPVALRQAVYARANGCCEYCLVPEALALAPYEIDHIIAEKHGGKTAEENLAFSCTLCNKYKGSDIASVDPTSQEIVRLYHPRQDQWSDHFNIQDGAIIVGLTSVGSVTARLLRLNRRDRIQERQLLITAGLIQIPKKA